MQNTEKTYSRSRIRLFFALILATATLLLMGASRLGDSMTSRQMEQEQTRLHWKTAADHLLRHQTRNHPSGTALRQLFMEHPEYILQAIHSGLRAEP